jgi:hypothetical protein
MTPVLSAKRLPVREDRQDRLIIEAAVHDFDTALAERTVIALRGYRIKHVG